MEESGLIAVPASENWLVGIDAPVAQERPVAAGFLAPGGVAFDDEDFLFIARSFGDNLTERIGDKGMAPEFQSRVTFLGFAFESHAVHNRRIYTIGDRMAPLNGPPSIELRVAKLRFLVRMPADTGGIKKNLCATERGDPRSFRIPLVPANLHADASVLGIEIRETEVAGREVKFLVVQVIVGDVHIEVYRAKALVAGAI